MKKNYLFTLLLILCANLLSFSQTTLSAGDIVVIELRADTPDTFKFVPLVDLEANTVIKFTENGWDGSALRTNESTITFTADAAITKGTNIEFVAGTSDTRFSVDGSLGFSSSGDQVIVYQGDSTSPNFIFAVQSNSTMWQTGSTGTTNSDLPTGLTDGTNAVAAGAGAAAGDEFDNIYYDGITTGTKAVLLASVAEASNWVGNNSTSYTPITSNFTVNEETTDPTITITSPANGSTIDATTSVDVKISVANFNVAASSAGDGYIQWTLDGVAQPNKFDASDETITVESGKNYTVYFELVDNSGNVLSPQANSTTAFSVAFPCDLALTTSTTTCDAITTSTDTYSTKIAFTGGNTGATYSVVASAGSVSGDDPNTVATGEIIVSGVPEGTDVTLTVSGTSQSICDLSRTITSPACFPLPISEDFSYADGSLTANPLWDSFSGTEGDLMVTSGQALVQHGTPSEDAQIQFAEITGDIYYSFDFTVVDPGAPIPGTDNEYFAMFKDSGFGFAGRVDIVPPSGNGDFSVGIASDNSTADAVWATDFTFGVKYRVTVKYDQAANIAELWVDANSETDTSISGADLTDPGRTIVAFALRQSDSDSNEGILVDNLKIASSFAETTLSVSNVEIDGFSTYPNPVSNGRFTISSLNSDQKEVSIFNILGKRVLTQSFTGNSKLIEVNSLNSGVYILKVKEGKNISTKKLVIR